MNRVKALLENAGMKNVTGGPHGVYVSAVATVAQLRTAFKVTQNLYTFTGRSLRANNQEPTIPAALAGKIVYIEGLDDTSMLRTPLHRSDPSKARWLRRPRRHRPRRAVTPPPVAAGNPARYCNTCFGAQPSSCATSDTAADVYGAAIPWLNCGYTPEQIQEAYGLNKVKLQRQRRHGGDHRCVCLADSDGRLATAMQPITACRSSTAAISRRSFRRASTMWIPSDTMRRRVRLVGRSNRSMWRRCMAARRARTSCSVGSTRLRDVARHCLHERCLQPSRRRRHRQLEQQWRGDRSGSAVHFDQAAMAGAAQGMTILFSSGDDGDLAAHQRRGFGCLAVHERLCDRRRRHDAPPGRRPGDKAEYGWGTYRAFLDDATVKSATSMIDSGVAQVTNFGFTYDDYEFYSGSGGGISLLEAQPSYQATAVPAYLAASLNLASGYTETLPNTDARRPDVAMDADPYTGYLYGETFTIAGDPIADAGCTPISETTEFCEDAIGGTSLASPLMAGVIAVMNPKRLASGEPLVGFANPLLYSIGSHGNGVVFNDAINQIIAPTEPVALLRGYLAN